MKNEYHTTHTVPKANVVIDSQKDVFKSAPRIYYNTNNTAGVMHLIIPLHKSSAN
jgi:hypothetical protein